MNKLNLLSRAEMKKVMGGDGIPKEEIGDESPCPAVVVNDCTKCDCTDARDWCVNGLCTKR